MKFLIDFFPVLAFFIAFKIPENTEQGIYLATATIIVATILQLAINWVIYRRFEKAHVITFAVVLVFGGATLWLHDERFIKWKPTIVVWIFALIALASEFIGDKNLFRRFIGIVDENINVPDFVWSRLNLTWVVFFILVGLLNLYVAFNYDRAIWVDFKVIGLTLINVLFMAGQIFYLFRYIKDAPEQVEKGSK